MKVTSSIVFLMAAVAQARNMIPQAGQQDLAAEKIDPQKLEQIGKVVAKVGGCVAVRFFKGASKLRCKPNKEYGGNTLFACVCTNQEVIAPAISEDFSRCTSKDLPFKEVIHKLGASIGGVGLSGICGALQGSLSLDH